MKQAVTGMVAAMTHMSRFKIHDEDSAPEGSAPILKGASGAAGQLPHLLGALAGSPEALRGYARFRRELAEGVLEPATTARLGLAVAEYHASEPGITQRTRSARAAGIGLDEIARAKRWASADPREAALLRWAKPLVTDRARVSSALHEETREAGWTERELLEATAFVAMETLSAWVNVAGDLPADGSTGETRRLRAVA
jgi:alkylhydroperoxidase family enzyme